jgi:two-component system, OmpR family, alkaline phosphatase synthesis response regulator PhoP
MKKKVLIIDDEPDVLMVISAIVKVLGYDVFTADNALEGIEICRRERHGLVLLDISMPEMDGIEACGVMKADKDIADTKIVFVTASTVGIEENKKQAGADGHIFKPFQTEQLADIVRSSLGDDKK